MSETTWMLLLLLAPQYIVMEVIIITLLVMSDMAGNTQYIKLIAKAPKWLIPFIVLALPVIAVAAFISGFRGNSK